MEQNDHSLDNAPLLRAIARMQTENSRESREAVLDLIISQAQFLAPADIVPETEGKEAALRFQLLTNQEGQPFFPAFTGWEELRKLCGGIVPDSVARKVLKILNQVVDDPQLIKIKSSGVPTTEDIRQRRLELDKLLQTPPVDEEIARQKAMELAVLTLVSVEMEEYEAHRLRSIFGKQAKMRELDANLLRQSVRKVTYGSKTVKVLLKNNQVLEECDDA